MQNNLSELIKIIEEKSNVSEIISDYISLEKKGNNHVGLCPFHSDSNPSMSVSDQKNIFKCFVCGAGGGAISFVQNYEGITFIEAVKKISDKLKVDWKQYISSREVKINPEEKRGWEINQEALNFFKYTLNNTSDDKVKSYINSRGIDTDVIEKFDIGYSGEGLSNFLLNKEFTEEEIIKYGLAKRREDTTLQDYFINRLIFAVKNKDGNVIGFSGRVIEDSKYSKYMNSPETPTFKKSNILYNLHNAKVTANLKKELIVVEGFMDVIALSKAGIENSIATMGTAFTKEHNKIIKSVTNKVILAFDSDAAGINATIATSKTLIQDGFDVKVVTVPSGKDFDELLKAGKEKVVDSLTHQNDFLTFYKEMIFKKLDSTPESIDIEVIKELLKVISYYNESILTDRNLNDISERYKISRGVLDQEYSKFTNVKRDEGTPFMTEYVPQQNTQEQTLRKVVEKVVVDQKNPRKLWLAMAEEEIIAYAVNNDDAFEYLKDNQIIIQNKELIELWSTYRSSIINNKKIDDEVLASRIKTYKERVWETESLNEVKDIVDLETYKEYINNYNNTFIEFSIDNLKRSIEEEKDFKEKENLFEMLSKLI